MHIDSLMPYSARDNFDIEDFLYEIICEFKLLIPGDPHLGVKPISVFASADSPIAYTNYLPTKYGIGLCITNIYFPQIAYQFAHELCHVYVDPRTTNWLIESFCESMSLIILDRLHQTRLATARAFGSNAGVSDFSWYLDSIESRHFSSLGLSANETLTKDMYETLKNVTTPYDRDTNFVNAWKIFAMFKRTPSILHLIPLLHHSMNAVTVGPEEFILEIHPNIHQIDYNVPIELRPVWTDLKTMLSLTKT